MRVGHAVLPISLWTLVTARLHNSLVPEDPYAFPKYRVAFLNGLPVLNDTAQRWLQNGIPGGEAEFLEQPLDESTPWSTQAVKSIDGEQRPEGTEPQVGLYLVYTRMLYMLIINLAHSQNCQSISSN